MILRLNFGAWQRGELLQRLLSPICWDTGPSLAVSGLLAALKYGAEPFCDCMENKSSVRTRRGRPDSFHLPDSRLCLRESCLLCITQGVCFGLNKHSSWVILLVTHMCLVLSERCWQQREVVRPGTLLLADSLGCHEVACLSLENVIPWSQVSLESMCSRPRFSTDCLDFPFPTLPVGDVRTTLLGVDWEEIFTRVSGLDGTVPLKEPPFCSSWKSIRYSHLALWNKGNLSFFLSSFPPSFLSSLSNWLYF